MEVRAIRQQLDQFAARLSVTSAGTNGSFRRSYEEFTAWLAGQRDPVALAAFENDAAFSAFRERFTLCQRRYLDECESLVARVLLEAGSRFEDVLGDAFARQTYDRLAEVTSLIDLSRCDHFVMVGCGAFPAALLFAVNETGAQKIVGLDAHAEAARLGAGVVRRHGRDRTVVLEADGLQFDYGGADVVYVANQVSPKHRVVARVAATARSGATVIVREPSGWGRLLAEDGLDPLPARLALGPTGGENRHFLSRHRVLFVT